MGGIGGMGHLNSTFADGRLTVTFRKPFDVLAQWPRSENDEGGDSGDQNRRRSEWSGWANAYRTSALDPDVCSTENILTLKHVSQPVDAAPTA